VSAQQDRLGDAFSKLGEYVSRRFAAKTEAELDKISARFDRMIAQVQARADAATPAERALAALDASEAARDRQRAQEEAQAQLTAAQAMEEGVEKERAVAAAKEAIRQAELAQRRAQLEAIAQEERAKADERAAVQIAKLEEAKQRELQNLEERRRQQGEALDRQLEQLANRLSKHPEEYDKIQKKVQNLLASYGIPMQKAGENLGKAFARGLREAADDVEAGAKKLADIVAKYLKLKSPAEKGPMSDLDRWWKPLGPMLAKQMMLPPVAVGAGAMAAHGLGMAAGGRRGAPSGGWPERIVLEVDRRVLTELVREEVQRTASRNR
jgi:hypothetical protein